MRSIKKGFSSNSAAFSGRCLFLRLFVGSLLPTPFAEFFKLDFLRHEFPVFSRPIVRATAVPTC